MEIAVLIRRNNLLALGKCEYGFRSFTGLEMSDEVIRSLAFLDRLPAVSSLLLTVKGEQPEEVLPYLSTMTATPADVLEALDTEIPRDELAAFAERGDVYLFFDARR